MLQPPVVIDVEASGFGRGSYPIEVGCVLPDGRSYCALILPQEDWTHWDESAEAVHGISREVLREHGLPALSVAIRLNALLKGMTVYSDAWAHDFVWLATLHEAAGVPPAYHLEHLARITPEIEASSWARVRDDVERSLEVRRHRASADARVLQMTWMCVMGNAEA
jgi:hypothetical protein